MKRKAAMIGLLIVISGMVILLWGCPPPMVRVRPPEPRVELPGPPPFPGAHWISGHWRHERGDWVWIPGHWDRPPRHGAVWVPAHWEPRGDGWVFVRGRWEHR